MIQPYYHYYNGLCSSELTVLVTLPLRCSRLTCCMQLPGLALTTIASLPFPEHWLLGISSLFMSFLQEPTSSNLNKTLTSSTSLVSKEMQKSLAQPFLQA
ncbi:Hypothetical predicted protein [Octopus vulgaris]|uniref:Uncharacterized protein n=1 Tax=Octopus vulgaris TaxID=6645 RepID=A0AA36F2H7_OCTVU|nr:Hypothetical predicted protein [Octopus vulgaris]